MIMRYDEIMKGSSALNPIDDYISFVNSLQSREVTEEILAKVHGIHDVTEIKVLAGSISSHVRYADKLLKAGLGSDCDISFLNTYYAILNLSKVMILLSNRREDLERERRHGASYRTPTNFTDIMNDVISVKTMGVIPLIYEIIHGNRAISGKEIALSSIYPFISDVSLEVGHVYQRNFEEWGLSIEVQSDTALGHRLIFHTEPAPLARSPISEIKAISGFNQDSFDQSLYATNYIQAATPEEARETLIKAHVKRHLLMAKGNIFGHTSSAISLQSNLDCSEEMAVLVAFFHLSNIIRYNPELMDRLKDSKDWLILSTLQRHGVLSFLRNFWSFTIKKNSLFF